MTDGTDVWRAIIDANGVAITEGQFQLLNRYHDLLKEWNTKINLVSRKDEGNIWPNHILHSLSLLFVLKFPNGLSIADVGSGGGLPGVPLAIMLPGVELVMIESIKKKCVAVTDILSRLHIKNAHVVNGRAEDIAKSRDYKNRFDLVVARAVSTLKELTILSRDLVGNKHHFSITVQSNTTSIDEELIPVPVLLALKGGNIGQEIAALDRMPGIGTVHSHDIQFRGIEKTGLVDKKLVIVSLSHTQL